MNRPMVVLLACVITAVTIPAVLHWGPVGLLVMGAGFGVGYGIGLLAERLTDDPEEYP